MGFEWYDFVRVGTVVLAFLSLYRLGMEAQMNRDLFTNKLKGLWWSMNVLLLMLMVITIEAIMLDQGFSARPILCFLAVAVSTYNVWKKQPIVTEQYLHRHMSMSKHRKHRKQ